MAILYLVIFGFFTLYKCIKDIHDFQQNSYTVSTYLMWKSYSKERTVYDYNRVALFSSLLFIMGIFFQGLILKNLFICLAFIFLYFSYFMFRFRKNAAKTKKPLVFTARVKRIIFTMVMLNALYFIVVISKILYWNSPYFETCAIIVNLFLNINSYIFVFLGNFINKPVEKAVKNWYINDARKLLKENKELMVIGITGSYGKTSVKNILASILSQKYSVLMTPESYNTPMGVVKTIRESLKTYDEIFIAEMGAYREGEIKEICDIVDPDLSVITSIGEQHLDTFKTKENIIKTKGEIFQNTVANGTAFVNLYDENIRSIKIRDDIEKIYFGKSEDEFLDKNSYCYAEKFEVTGEGTKVTINSVKYGVFDVKTRFLGRHNIENIVLCVAIGIRLGLSPNQINKGLMDIEPVEHRLSYKKNPAGYTIIDDAFNSNPVGSRNALEVLKLMEGNKKIVMTPGMIGLGEKEEEYNEKFGEYMIGICDYVILVGDKQTKAIQKGLKNVMFPEDGIKVVKNTSEAFSLINKIIDKDDVILIENDLPDIFNE